MPITRKEIVNLVCFETTAEDFNFNSQDEKHLSVLYLTLTLFKHYFSLLKLYFLYISTQTPSGNWVQLLSSLYIIAIIKKILLIMLRNFWEYFELSECPHWNMDICFQIVFVAIKICVPKSPDFLLVYLSETDDGLGFYDIKLSESQINVPLLDIVEISGFSLILRDWPHRRRLNNCFFTRQPVQWLLSINISVVQQFDEFF